MKRTFTLFIIACITLAISNMTIAQTIVFNEGFEDITLLPGQGWVETNLSATIGSVGYFQGNTTVFSAYQGTATSYLGVNFNSTTGNNTISNWMISPQMTLENGDVVSFWTRCAGSTYPDRLQLRLNPTGTTNAGATATSVGDFTVLLSEVNPSLTAGGYPDVWTEFTATISGLTGPTSCRIAFRYFVTSGGPSGANSDYIGIDEFSVTRTTTVINHDLGVTAITSPTTGILTSTENISVTINNFGTNNESNFNVSVQVNGGAIVTENVSATVNAGASTNYTFTNTFDLSTPGNYNIKAWTELLTDEDNTNDTLTVSITSLASVHDIGVTALTNPTSGILDDSETVTVTITNFGTENETGFDVSFQINGGTVITEVVSATINSGATYNHTFSGVYDFSAAGTINVVAWTNLLSDSDNSNDTLTTTVNNTTNIQMLNIEKFNIYPNPASEFITINTKQIPSGTYVVQIINELGQVMNSIQLNSSIESETSIPIDLPSGKYIIILTDPKSKTSGTHTFVVQ